METFIISSADASSHNNRDTDGSHWPPGETIQAHVMPDWTYHHAVVTSKPLCFSSMNITNNMKQFLKFTQ